MNRFEKLFLEKKKVRFVPFFTLGDPSFNESLNLIKTAIDAGADALELGFPFSDPVADGPTNQRSMARGLKAKMDVDQCLKLIKAIRNYNKEIPIGLLLYYNLIFKRGDKIYQELQDVGVDAVVSADLPLEESKAHQEKLKKHNIGVVQMVAPNTPLKRAKILFDQSNAFTYVLSGFGPTGAKKTLAKETLDRVEELRAITDKPMIVGFGLSEPEHVKLICQKGADAAIVGSYFSSIIENNLDNPKGAQQIIGDFILKVNEHA